MHKTTKMTAKRLGKRTISCLLAALMVLSALPLTALSALAATSGDFEYEVLSETDKTCEITGYTGSATALEIPSELDGYMVTSIGEDAFNGCESLTSITIPDSVTSIDWYAFSGCAALTSITIPNSVTSIGGWAFNGCKSLTSITIPNSVTSIGDYAFWGCTALTEIKVDTGNPNYTSESGVLFNRNKTALICYPAGKQDSSYIVPDSVTSIGDCAFYACTSLESITIPDSVTSIGEDAFSYCTSLIGVTIPNSVTSIGRYAFYGCTALTEIKVDTGNPNYTSESGVLFNRNKTALICYPAGKQDSSYIVPDSVTSIGNRAFSDCSALTSITIPDSVTSIGEWAFYACTSLESITIPDSVTSIGDWAFYVCTSLENITIPNSVTSIGDGAFRNCTTLTSITIPDSVTSIGDGAFFGCTSLESITIPDSVTSIGEWAFSNCTTLTSITIPDSVTSIGEFAFYACTSLENITIPDSVTSIGEYVFSNSGLTTIYGYTGSYAETFASANGYTFVALQKLTDAETGVSVGEGNFGNFAENTVLNVEKLSAEENTITYDITLTVNNEIVQPASAVTVKIPVPETMDGAQCKVYRQEADGTYTDMQATYQNGYMVFTTDHFSIYVLTTADPNVPTYTLGDVNGDEKINAVDARWVLQAASGARVFDAAQTAAADVNGDGKVNAVDARWILQVASGARTL